MAHVLVAEEDAPLRHLWTELLAWEDHVTPTRAGRASHGEGGRMSRTELSGQPFRSGTGLMVR